MRLKFHLDWLFLVMFRLSLRVSARLICLASAVFMASGLLFAQNPADPAIRRVIERGMEQSFQNNFAGAEAAFQELINAYPEQPFGYFYRGAVIQAGMLDQESYDRLDEFNGMIDRCMELAKKQKEAAKGDEQLWPLFYEGSGYLYRSFMDSKLHKIWGAYRNAVRGVNRLEKVIEIDSSFYEAYLGVGSYKYWKSTKARALAWLPFISDEREKGVLLLRKALLSAGFSKLVARDQMAWVLLNFGQVEEARQLALANHQAYPESRFFLWTLAEVDKRCREWEEAFQIYEQLLGQLRSLPENNHYNEISALLAMAEISYQNDNFVRADSLAEELLSLSLNDEVRQRSRSKREQAQKLRQKCAKEFAKLEAEAAKRN